MRALVMRRLGWRRSHRAEQSEQTVSDRPNSNSTRTIPFSIGTHSPNLHDFGQFCSSPKSDLPYRPPATYFERIRFVKIVIASLERAADISAVTFISEAELVGGDAGRFYAGAERLRLGTKIENQMTLRCEALTATPLATPTPNTQTQC